MTEQEGKRSALIGRVVSHFNGLERCSCNVPEWGASPEEPLIVYWSRWMIEDRQKMRAAFDRFGNLAGLVEILVLKAEDAEGKKLFTLEDKPELLRFASAAVIERVALMIASDAEIQSADDAAKKSRPIPSC